MNGMVLPQSASRPASFSPDIPVGDVAQAWQLETFLGVGLVDAIGVGHVKRVLNAELGALDLRHVEEALHELGLQRHRFFLGVEDQRVDERHGLAAVGQQAGFLFARHALAGIRLAAEIRVALEHMAAVLHVVGQHVGTGAHRPHVQRQAAARHAGLGVKLVGLPRHRCHEGHRQPVLPLRVLAVDADAQRVAVERRRAGQRELAKVEEGLVQAGLVKAGAQLLVLGADQRAVVLQADHVLGEGAVDRRHDARRGMALHGVDEIVGHQLACAVHREVERRALVAQLAGLHVVIQEAALRVFRERRVRRELNALADRDVVDALGDQLGRHVVGQGLAGFVEVFRRDHLGRDLRDQRVRPLQVVIAVQRLVVLVSDRRFVVRIRSRGIEVAG